MYSDDTRVVNYKNSRGNPCKVMQCDKVQKRWRTVGGVSSTPKSKDRSVVIPKTPDSLKKWSNIKDKKQVQKYS